MTDHSVPAEYADHLLDFFVASRAAEFATVDAALATLLGHEPTPLSTVLRKQLPNT
ncbi:hypothetical protein ACTWPT_36015 [Nonomuraea sp. 3N208]|uniref:hypothetical protein n=1 Tax=Nonomuraea sp. 3N208 TaxID=3457421 RepID=UPI003FD3B9C3